MELITFLQVAGIELNLDSYKLHFASGKHSEPLQEYFGGKFKEWQEYQTRPNFTRTMVIGLIELKSKSDKWLFAGVYRVGDYKKVRNPDRNDKKKWLYRYSTELLDGQEEYIGRVIVHYDRTNEKGKMVRNACLIGKRDGGNYPISEYLPTILLIDEFPGYGSVNISLSELEVIVNQKVGTWYGALANTKGVYLITDQKNGKLYVGSASGDDGIWQRWADYAKNGHGGNKELRKILKDNGLHYAKNFRYSILELHSDDEFILKRESHWKTILRTRDQEHGYNSN